MSQDAQIVFSPGVLPEGICPQNEQERFNLYTTFLSGFLPGNFSSFNIGTTTPTVDNQDKPWLKLNADGAAVRWYVFANGAWVWPHHVPAESGSENMLVMYSGTLTGLITFDGGSAGAVTATTGPMWKEVTSFADNVPIGAGTVAAAGIEVSVFTAGAGTPQVRGVYFIRRTARTHYVA